jgi:Immunity protein 35
MEINIKKAKEIALEFLNKNYHSSDDELIILDEETIEKEYGWYLFSSSKRFQETLDICDMVVGNGVTLVKKNGEVLQFGTAFHPEYYIQEYEKTLLKA